MSTSRNKPILDILENRISPNMVMHYGVMIFWIIFGFVALSDASSYTNLFGLLPIAAAIYLTSRWISLIKYDGESVTLRTIYRDLTIDKDTSLVLTIYEKCFWYHSICNRYRD